MATEEDIKNFPRPKPDNSPKAKAKVMKSHQEQIQPLIEKRAKRARAGGSWKTVGGKVVLNPDDPKNKRVAKLREEGKTE
jgi:hypothetical protein